MRIEKEYQELRDMASKFADNEVAPLAAQIDHESSIPTSLIQKLKEMGFFGIFIPEELGGAGLDYTSYAIIMDELSRGCASTGVLISAHNSLCNYHYC